MSHCTSSKPSSSIQRRLLNMLKLSPHHALPLVLLFFVLTGAFAQPTSFRKIIIDSTYVSSAVTVADIDRDGNEDIIAGDVWYTGPDWIRNEIRPLGNYRATLVDSTLDGVRYYARSIGNYTLDVDGDGWLDVLTFNSQGASCYWYRNPQKNYDKPWPEFVAIEMFHNESPQVVDLFADGNPVILAGHHIGDRKFTLSWFEPTSDPTQLWEAHVVGHPDHFDYQVSRAITEYYAPGGRGHGLGVGLINDDVYLDIITAQGWYEGSVRGREEENWKFHAVPFDTIADPTKINLLFAQMFADDFDGDGDQDIIGGSAHAYGLWWFEQIKKGDELHFVKHEIRMDLSQLHAMNAVDLNGDGLTEYVTGKRFLAHLGRDPGAFDPAIIAYVEKIRGPEDSFSLQTHIIDDNSGSGTQIWITDYNQDQKPDILTSNKKGTHLFLQE